MRNSYRILAFVLVFIAGVPALAGTEGIPLLVTVDDLPMSGSLHRDPEERLRLTREMLAALERHAVPAVGFVNWGRLQEGDEAVLAAWLEAGHELGNHTANHPSLHRLTAAEFIADAEAGRAGLAEFLRQRDPASTVRFFRFPYLREGDSQAKLDAVRAYLDESGQRNVPVTLDNQDWSLALPWLEAGDDETAQGRIAESYHESMHVSIRSQWKLSERLFDRPVPQVLLLHAMAVSGAQWDRLFEWLKEKGYRFAAADEVLADPVFAEAPGYVGSHGPGLWHREQHERRKAEAVAEIKTFLLEQAEAWNRGDLVTFADSYAEDALFVSPTGLTRGRAEVLARYQRRYPDGKAMGHLTFEFLSVEPVTGTEVSLLGDAVPSAVHGATVVARWMLGYPDEYEREDASGLTLIVLRRKTGGGWEVTEDASM
ncbi:MAG: polysaccharide deacetylase family protein [Acidobacteriota bacterium]